MKQRFHLREPTKLTMLERGVLVRQIEDFVKFCEETYPTVRLLYVEMTPRHTDRCCSDREHMGEDDVWVLDNQRREVDMEIRRRLGERLEFVSWYESSGLEKEPELAQIRKMGVVSEDGSGERRWGAPDGYVLRKYCRESVLQGGGGGGAGGQGANQEEESVSPGDEELWHAEEITPVK